MKRIVKQFVAIHVKSSVQPLKALPIAFCLAVLFWVIQGAGGSPWLGFDSVSTLVSTLVKHKLFSTLAVTAGGCALAGLVKDLIGEG